MILRMYIPTTHIYICVCARSRANSISRSGSLLCIAVKYEDFARSTCCRFYMKYIFRSVFLVTLAKVVKATSTLCVCVCLSVCPSAWNNSAPTGRIFMKFDIKSIFRKSVEKIRVSLKSDKNNGYFT